MSTTNAAGICPRCGGVVGIWHTQPQCDAMYQAAYDRAYAAAAAAWADVPAGDDEPTAQPPAAVLLRVPEGCLCAYNWRSLGRVYGQDMGSAWTRATTERACPLHGDRLHPTLTAQQSAAVEGAAAQEGGRADG